MDKCIIIKYKNGIKLDFLVDEESEKEIIDFFNKKDTTPLCLPRDGINYVFERDDVIGFEYLEEIQSFGGVFCD